MNFFSKLFSKDNGKVECPRCLGKGHVDWDDIKRLNQQLKWRPGKCAYCEGSGKIKPQMQSIIPVDSTYLTTSLSKEEKMRLIEKDDHALHRAKIYEDQIDNFIEQVSLLHFKGGMNPGKIAEFFLTGPDSKKMKSVSHEDEKELIDYIERVIEHQSNGQNQLIDITSNTEEGGFQDIILKIVDKQLNDDFWTITAKGQHDGIVVGLSIKIKNGIKPGIVNGEIDSTAFVPNAVEFSSIGKESDEFISILSEIYGLKTSQAFSSKPVIFTCFSLNTNQGLLDKGAFGFKLFYDESDENNLYSEIYLNPNFPDGTIELAEKDPEYRENIIKAMTL